MGGGLCNLTFEINILIRYHPLILLWNNKVIVYIKEKTTEL